MQADQYFNYFQALSTQWLQFTLENPAYALCLAISVWLLTAVFYSFRIGSLKKIINTRQQELQETQAALAGTQQQLHAAQDELANSTAQLAHVQTIATHKTEKLAHLQEECSTFGKQFADTMQRLGGPALSADLSLGELWVNFLPPLEQLQQSLRSEQIAHQDLQALFKTASAKLAETEQQRQLLQTSLDSQNQKLIQLELSLNEHKTLLSQQQNTQLRVAELEAQLLTETTQRSTFEKQLLELQKTPPAILSEKPKVVAVPVSQLEPVKPAVIIETQPPAAPEVAPKPAPSIPVETPKTKPAEVKAEVSSAPATSGSAGKFKNMFGNVMQKVAKLDAKLDGKTSASHYLGEADAAEAAELPVETPVETPVAVVEHPTQVESVAAKTAAKKASGSLGGKFKNMFSKDKANTKAEKAADIAPIAQEAPTASAVESHAETSPKEQISGKLKSLFASGKDKAAKSAPAAAVVVEPGKPSAAEETKTAKPNALKGLFDKIKRIDKMME